MPQQRLKLCSPARIRLQFSKKMETSSIAANRAVLYILLRTLVLHSRRNRKEAEMLEMANNLTVRSGKRGQRPGQRPLEPRALVRDSSYVVDAAAQSPRSPRCFPPHRP